MGPRLISNIVEAKPFIRHSCSTLLIEYRIEMYRFDAIHHSKVMNFGIKRRVNMLNFHNSIPFSKP